MSARKNLLEEYGWAESHPLGTMPEFRQKLDAYREETRREILGSDLNPSSLVLDAQAYRQLRETITSTMDDPDRWDRDGDEESVLSEYVRWLADGKPARDDGWEDDPSEGMEYQVVGDWGVDGADSEAEARADVAKALWVHPTCGAYAEQRIVRTWPDGSEFHGPWTRLPGND